MDIRRFAPLAAAFAMVCALFIAPTTLFADPSDDAAGSATEPAAVAALDSSAAHEGQGWALSADGVLTVTADIPDQADNEPYEWAKYADQVKEVKAAEGVTRIPFAAFASSDKATYSQLAKVTTSSTVREIKGAAFAGNPSLVEVHLNEGLTTVGAGAFRENGFSQIELPANVEWGSDVFSDCTNLTSVTIPAGSTWGGNAQFYNCTGLKTVTVEDGVTEIPNQFLNGCVNVEKVYLPASATVGLVPNGGKWDSPILYGTIIAPKDSAAARYAAHWIATGNWPSLKFQASDSQPGGGVTDPTTPTDPTNPQNPPAKPNPAPNPDDDTTVQPVPESAPASTDDQSGKTHTPKTADGTALPAAVAALGAITALAGIAVARRRQHEE